MKNLKNNNRLVTYFFEIVVIIIGITLSFLVNEWRENSKIQKEEITALETILENLRTDSTNIEREIYVLAKSDSLYDYFLHHVFDKNPRLDSLGKAFQAIFTYSKFTPKSIGYQQLKETGILNIISDKDLLKDLIELYTATSDLIAEQNFIDKTISIEYVGTHLINEFDLLAISPTNIKKLSDNQRARNFLTGIRNKKFLNLTLFTRNIKLNEKISYEKYLADVKKLIIEVESALISLK